MPISFTVLSVYVQKKVFQNKTLIFMYIVLIINNMQKNLTLKRTILRILGVFFSTLYNTSQGL